MSRILKNVLEAAERLYQGGLLAKDSMREFEMLCDQRSVECVAETNIRFDPSLIWVTPRRCIAYGEFEFLFATSGFGGGLNPHSEAIFAWANENLVKDADGGWMYPQPPHIESSAIVAERNPIRRQSAMNHRASFAVTDLSDDEIEMILNSKVQTDQPYDLDDICEQGVSAIENGEFSLISGTDGSKDLLTRLNARAAARETSASRTQTASPSDEAI